MELSERQVKIVQIVKEKGPITGEQIADLLELTRATLRPDLAILTMSGILEARPRVGYYYNGRSGNTLVARAISKLRVKDIKSLPVVARETASVYDAVVTMFTEDVGTLSVVDGDGYLSGVVSRKDLLKIAISGGDVHKMPVGMVMTRMPNIITVTPDDTVYLAAKRLITHQIDALPVVRTFVQPNGQERLEVVGRLTKTNITRFFVELGNDEL
ncbi:CBS domain-containing protein [Heliobacterium undosum]|uniref:CBS domain-containing protein n=1 Tax=Heliomicrobium undosum TaxID=121734 RepID=A0A845L4U3_9FIRM|nr:helix-turn-helix transcriptional regulator [Heliomicrobium undosum]MZP28788.1 CBS domain-containing protein [Heliomicrobium undosum]